MRSGEALKTRIFELCDERSITPNNLCTISGVTQSTLNNLLGGRNQTMTVATIHKFCDGLNISLRDFFDTSLFEGLEQEVK